MALAKRLIRMQWNDQRLALRFGAVSMAVILIQGSFPKYKALISSQTGPSVTVLAEDMERCCRQLKRLAKEDANIVRLS